MNDDQISQFERYTQQQRFDEAFNVCSEAIRNDDSDWNAIYLAGICLRFQGDSGGAIGYYQQALQLNPNVATIWLALGIALQSLRQYPDAIKALSTAVHLDSNSYASHNSLGLTYKLAGNYTSAMRAYEAALQICANRAYTEVRHQHPEFFRVELLDGSHVLVINRAYMEVMRQILATDFDYFNTIKNMVSCCVEMGDHRKAAELQNHADNCTPIDADIIGPIQVRK
jgi:tetratricopeptide (TPR) repeat protein